MTFTDALRAVAKPIAFASWAFMLPALLCVAVSAGAEQRFVDRMFTDIGVQRGIQFGVGRRDSGSDQPLFLDVYAPNNDTNSRRPVVVLAFPGGFVEGSRDSAAMMLLATQFAERGYVAASIDYRLIEGSPDSNAEIEVSILQAVHDMRAAIRFFREDAASDNEFGTDGVHVFVGGISAGAVMSAITSVLDEGDDLSQAVSDYLAANGGMAGNSSTNIEFSHDVSGVLQISGAIRRLSWIDPGNAPIFAAHEEFDPVVPCTTLPGIAFAEFALALTSSGACDMIPAARAVGVPTEFFFERGSFAHIGYSFDELMDIFQDSATFFYNEALRPKTLASAVLPGSRSVQVGDEATVFASVINTTSEEASGCSIEPMTGVDASFSYQPTDAANAPMGEADTPFVLAPGATQNLVLTFEPDDDFSPTEVFLEFKCSEGPAANSVQGVNTLLLSADNDPVADVVGLTTVVDLVADADSTALFAVGSANVGAGDEINVSLDTGSANLPVDLLLCETDSATGVCIADPSESVTLSYSAASTRSFAVFANATGAIDNNPATNRIFVRFRDISGTLRGATSTAIRTQ